MSIDIRTVDDTTLLRAIEMASQKDGDAKPHRPVMEAQRMELRSRFDSLAVKHDLKVGDLVRFKHGLSHIKDADKKAMIIWRMLVPGTVLDDAIVVDLVKEIAFFHETDCLVAFLTDDGAAIHLTPAPTAYLEPDR